MESSLLDERFTKKHYSREYRPKEYWETRGETYHLEDHEKIQEEERVLESYDNQKMFLFKKH